MPLARLLICLITGFFVAQILFYYPNLPAQLAAHFDAASEPHDWMEKSTFVSLEVIILLIVVAQFALLPRLIEKMPDYLINRLRKEFWPAGERRHETLLIVRNYFDLLGAALLGLLVAVNQIVFRANISQTNLSGSPLSLIIGAFLLFTLGWVIKFGRHFKIKKI